MTSADPAPVDTEQDVDSEDLSLLAAMDQLSDEQVAAGLKAWQQQPTGVLGIRRQQDIWVIITLLTKGVI